MSVVDIIQPHHFQPDEDQDDREPILEQVELVDSPGEQEVHRAEAHDGREVRCEHDQGFARDGEDGGHGIYGEDDVGGF